METKICPKCHTGFCRKRKAIWVSKGWYWYICQKCEQKQKREYAKNNPEILREKDRRWKKRNKKKIIQSAINRHRKDREMALQKYGGKCTCCGEKKYEFLTFDHINACGGKGRIKFGGKHIVPWLKKNNYPKGIQILCWNCNSAKHFHKICPHKK